MVEVRTRLGNDVKRRSVRLVAALLLVPLGLSTAACGVTRGEDTRDLLMIIPNSPGGGYDQTGRAAVGVMEERTSPAAPSPSTTSSAPAGPRR